MRWYGAAAATESTAGGSANASGAALVVSGGAAAGAAGGGAWARDAATAPPGAALSRFTLVADLSWTCSGAAAAGSRQLNIALGSGGVAPAQYDGSAGADWLAGGAGGALAAVTSLVTGYAACGLDSGAFASSGGSGAGSASGAGFPPDAARCSLAAGSAVTHRLYVSWVVASGGALADVSAVVATTAGDGSGNGSFTVAGAAYPLVVAAAVTRNVSVPGTSLGGAGGYVWPAFGVWLNVTAGCAAVVRALGATLVLAGGANGTTVDVCPPTVDPVALFAIDYGAAASAAHAAAAPPGAMAETPAGGASAATTAAAACGAALLVLLGVAAAALLALARRRTLGPRAVAAPAAAPPTSPTDLHAAHGVTVTTKWVPSAASVCGSVASLENPLFAHRRTASAAPPEGGGSARGGGALAASAAVERQRFEFAPVAAR